MSHWTGIKDIYLFQHSGNNNQGPVTKRNYMNEYLKTKSIVKLMDPVTLKYKDLIK
jgi:hypothetical protein